MQRCSRRVVVRSRRAGEGGRGAGKLRPPVQSVTMTTHAPSLDILILVLSSLALLFLSFPQPPVLASLLLSFSPPLSCAHSLLALSASPRRSLPFRCVWSISPHTAMILRPDDECTYVYVHAYMYRRREESAAKLAGESSWASSSRAKPSQKHCSLITLLIP